MATAASAQGLPPATASAVDSTFYPEHDHEMGTNALEMLLRELLRPLLARFLAHHGRPLFVGSDQFIYYQQYNSKACVAPDLYVHPGLAPNATPRMLKTWEVGPPLLALEIVSSDKAKDYLRSPRRYDEVGALELFLYDPEFLTHPEGHRWTAFRRERAGQEWKVEQTGDSAVYSEQLRCWFKEVKGPGHPLLRIADDDFGSHLFPTEQEEILARAEAEAQARAQAEQKAEAEAEGRKKAEAALADALARLASLEAQLKKP